MEKATDALLKDHLMIRKMMESFNLENPRFAEIAKTLERVSVAHAWFEDAIFLPALKAEAMLDRLNREISEEHRDIEELFRRCRRAAQAPTRDQEGNVLQLRSILETHFRKEEDALFPLAERILDSEGLNRLGAEMVRRKDEVRSIVLPD
jgi:hemerythrin-like domain-containing protein